MHVKSLMIPFNKLKTLKTTDTVASALECIRKNDLLSLPVVDSGNRFVGILSRRYVYEEFFNQDEYDKESFMKRPVAEFMKEKIPVIKENISIEEAALFLFEKRLRFLPIVDEDTNVLEGIITSSKLLEKYKDFFGIDHPKLVIYIYDFKGKLANIASIISKAGGNILNIVQIDTAIMGFQEISLRVEADDIKKVVRHLEKHDIEVREFSE